MRNWEDYLDTTEDSKTFRKFKKKINKNIFCKKNKIKGTNYGHHVYDEKGTRCILCGHLKKEKKLQLEDNDERDES